MRPVDLYYRSVTRSAGQHSGLDAECVRLGGVYVEALETLHSHLLTLRFDAEIDVLLQATERYLTLVRKELDSSRSTELA